MSVYANWATALETKDLEAAMACVAEDYTFVRHQSGTTLDKSGLAGMLKAMMASDDVHFRDRRCIYENDEILVEHVVVDFADGSREAVLTVSHLKDGKMTRSETGATAIAT